MNPVETPIAPNKVNGAPLGVAESQLLHSSLLAMAQDGASNGPPALSTTPTLSGLLQAIKRRWLLALTVAVTLSALMVTMVFIAMPPKYNVSLRLRVIAKQAGGEDIEFPIFKANMEAMVRNPIVLSSALNDKTADGREIKDLELVRSKGMGAIDWLEKNIKTDYLLGPEILRATLPADSAEDAAELMNAIARAFFKEYAELEMAKKQVRIQELRQKKDAIEREISSLRGHLSSQLTALNVKDREAVNTHQQQWVRKLSDAEAGKRTIDIEMAAAESVILSATARLKNIDKLEVPDDILFDFYNKDSTLIDFQKSISDLDRLISSYYAKYNEPFASQYAGPLKEEKKRTNTLKEKREKELMPKIESHWRKRVSDDLKTRIGDAEEKIQICRPQREKAQKEIEELEKIVRDGGASLKPATIVATEDKIELTSMTLRQTVQRMTEVELEPPVSRVVPVTTASAPQEKDISRQTKVAGAGGLGIFLMALFGVGFYEFRSRKISNPGEVATGLGLNVVGTIPVMPSRSRKPSAKEEITEQKWLAQLQESVDAIRTVILHQARTNAMHVIMVTSAQSGEGKTTLATQLAASLARAWKRTLVIDADLRHPAVHALFDTPQEPGLAEVLRGEVEPADAVRATPVSRLWVLPAGNGDGHAIQALAQDNVRTLFEQLKQQYDFIIIDTPPLLPVADSLLIGQHVDGVLFAILRDVSRAPAIYAAQQKLAPLGVNMLGAVVLGTEAEFSDKQYGYAMNQATK